jgi:hypothetical protein
MYGPAASLLEWLLAEDDAAMEVWYLLGEAQLHAGELEAARETLQTADKALCQAIDRIAASAASKGKAKSGGGKPSRRLGATSLTSADDADAGLLAFSRDELLTQRTMMRRLLAVVQTAMDGSGPSSSAATATTAGSGMDLS